jgi:hypothetical protein
VIRRSPTTADIITTVEQATPEWLSQVLHEDGALEEGRVVAVTRRANDAFNSSIAHLDLTYSTDAWAPAPAHLLLKLNHRHDGALEARFYAFVATLSADLPMLVRCCGAACAQTSGDSFCLLADLSSTHTSPVTRQKVLASAVVPAETRLVGIVAAPARFHAYWWEHAQLRQAAGASGERP